VTVARLLGYARVSTLDQEPALQLDALAAAGCRQVYTDHASGALDRRPELDRVLADLDDEDTLVVWRLDRLGRSTRHLLELMTVLEQRGVGFRSLREELDTTTPAGRLFFTVFAALGEFERELIVERTRAGLTAARARGRVGGRPSSLQGDKLAEARRMVAERRLTSQQIADVLGVSRSALYRALNRPIGDTAATAGVGE